MGFVRVIVDECGNNGKGNKQWKFEFVLGVVVVGLVLGSLTLSSKN